MVQKRKKKTDEDDSHRTLDIHLLDQIGVCVGGHVGEGRQADLIAPPRPQSSHLPPGEKLQVCLFRETLLDFSGLCDLSPSRVPALTSCLQAGPCFLANMTISLALRGAQSAFSTHFRCARGSPQRGQEPKLSGFGCFGCPSQFSLTASVVMLKHAWPSLAWPLGPPRLFQGSRPEQSVCSEGTAGAGNHHRRLSPGFQVPRTSSVRLPSPPPCADTHNHPLQLS